MRAIVILACKDLKQLSRNRMGIFWIFFFPVVMALFFGAIFGGSRTGGARKLPVAVVDEDRSEASRAFVGRLARSEALSIEARDLGRAHDGVRLGKHAAYVVIPKGFGDAAPFAAHARTSLQVGIDPTHQAEGAYLRGLLIQASFEGLQDRLKSPQEMRPSLRRSIAILEKPEPGPPDRQREVISSFLKNLDGFLGNVDPRAFQRAGPLLQPLEIRTISVTRERSGPLNAFEISFPQAILWALIACSTSFALAMVRERMLGTYLRLKAAPLGPAQILSGKGLACFLSAGAVVVFLLVLGRLACGVRLEHPLLLLLAIPSSAACFVGLMMFVSVLGKTDQAVSGGGWGILMIFSMLGGGMVPLFVMPSWMAAVSHLSPVKWAILALEGAIWRDFTLQEMLVPCGILLAFGAFFWMLGLARFGRMDRS
jgi:ABC-2 type transport system permease protein